MKKRAPSIRIIVIVLAAVLSATALPPDATAAARTPSEAASHFYRAYVKLKVRGLPNASQRKVLWPMLSEDIRAMFDAAQREQDRFVKESPDEKPPWIEGDLFSSLFEGATSFRLGSATLHCGRGEVEIHLTYREGRDTVRWTDTLVLTRAKDGWRVWDILFNGKWAFKTGENLRGVLRHTGR
ncbi:MAG: hypothetical protein AB9866_08155 [Syntrophobacteraceae bacterium]